MCWGGGKQKNKTNERKKKKLQHLLAVNAAAAGSIHQEKSHESSRFCSAVVRINDTERSGAGRRVFFFYAFQAGFPRYGLWIIMTEPRHTRQRLGGGGGIIHVSPGAAHGPLTDVPEGERTHLKVHPVLGHCA